MKERNEGQNAQRENIKGFLRFSFDRQLLIEIIKKFLASEYRGAYCILC